MLTTDRPTPPPPPELRFRRDVNAVRALRAVWQRRELIASLAEREYRVRYKQAVLGFAWAIIVPVIMLGVFTLLFKRVANIDTGGAPYTLFAYLGLLPWTFFSTSVAQGGTSLLSNTSLLNKVACPREVFPIASIVVAGIDTTIALSVLVVLFPITGYPPELTAVWVPVLFAVQLAFTVGTVLVVSSTIVYLRDLRHALPIILQLGLFATPVAYGMDVIDEKWQWLYALLNPLAPVIDGYRRTVLFGEAPDPGPLLAGSFSALVILVVGYLLFKRLEAGIADVA
jgi:ABC-type polysaccharide/polyol phosphate export permease